MLSNELQIGKAGEHFVCTDLILNGYNAFLADQGLPFDVVVEKNDKLYSIQVKTTLKKINTNKVKDIYRFYIRRGNKNNNTRRIKSACDFIAFVCLDKFLIAYIPTKHLLNTNGFIKTCVEFRDKDILYSNRIYKNGTIGKINNNAKFIQNFKFVLNND